MITEPTRPRGAGNRDGARRPHRRDGHAPQRLPDRPGARRVDAERAPGLRRHVVPGGRGRHRRLRLEARRRPPVLPPLRASRRGDPAVVRRHERRRGRGLDVRAELDVPEREGHVADAADRLLTTDPQCYEYNLRVYPPDATSKFVRIVAAGPQGGRDDRRSTSSRRTCGPRRWPTTTASSTATCPGERARRRTGRSTPTATSTTTGPRRRTSTPRARSRARWSMQNGAQRYDVDSNPTIRSQIKNPIDFTSFLTSFTDIERASQLGRRLPERRLEGRLAALVQRRTAPWTSRPVSAAARTTSPTCSRPAPRQPREPPGSRERRDLRRAGRDRAERTVGGGVTGA